MSYTTDYYISMQEENRQHEKESMREFFERQHPPVTFNKKGYLEHLKRGFPEVKDDDQAISSIKEEDNMII